MKLNEILTDIFDPRGIPADLYTGDGPCRRIGRAMIANITTYPAKQITGITLFLDPLDTISAAQMSTYTPDEGLTVHFLDGDLH